MADEAIAYGMIGKRCVALFRRVMIVSLRARNDFNLLPRIAMVVDDCDEV